MIFQIISSAQYGSVIEINILFQYKEKKFLCRKNIRYFSILKINTIRNNIIISYSLSFPMRTVKLESGINDPVIDVAIDTINKEKQALLFVNTKRSAEKVAEDISKNLLEINELVSLADEIENILGTPTRQCLRLGKCIRKGIAFHHAGLHQKQRELIEDGFRDGIIKIIACTPTLAAGLDMPAFRAIIRDLKRHGGVWGMSPIPVLEYHQMAGRAGRPGKDSYGEAITIAKSDDELNDIVEKYIRGKPESIYSKLAVEPVLRTYILSLIASGFINTEDSLIEFFSKTFWAKQYRDMNKLVTIIHKMTDLLEDYGFIYKNKSTNTDEQQQSEDSFVDDEFEEDFVSASSLDISVGKNGINAITPTTKLRATLIGKRVAELYLDPYTANHLITCMKDASNMTDLPLESYLHMISHTIEMRPLIRMRKKTEETVSDFLMINGDKLLETEPSMYDDEFHEFYDSINTTLFFSEWIEEKDEDYLFEKFNIRPGETRYKLDTAEWLLFACTEFTKILQLKDLRSILNKLSIRVKYGVKEELLPLLKFKNVGRVRARKLFDNGIKDVGDIKRTSITTLSQIVGGKLAETIKEQVGQNIDEVSDKKRVGQMSVEKYA